MARPVILIDNQRYELMTNINPKYYDQFNECNRLSNLNGRFMQQAYDIYGKLLPELIAFYIPEGSKNSKEYDLFFEYDKKIKEEYKKQLIENGIYTEKELEGQIIYLGCEKYI